MTLLTMSADSHVTEPGDCYLDRIDPRFRDRAPRAVTDDVMGAVLLIDEGKSRIPYGMVAAAGRPAERIGPFEYVAWDELHAGGWDPVARLAEQALDGVASEVLYPSAGMLICNMDDADYKKACFDAYNLWIAEFQATSPSRLVGVGQTALRSVAEGIEDLRRIRDLGLRGVMMPGIPSCLDEVGDYDDPAWDPLWEAAVGLGMPLSFHILTARSNIGGAEFRGPKMNSFLGILRANQDIVGTLVFGGVFDRHPDLQVVCVEADAGWVPHWAYRADHAADRHRNWLTASMERRPSEYLFENVSFTFQDDWTAFRVVDQMNHRKLLWASDHPHSDATWPDSQALLAEHTAGMSTEVRDDIVWRNCARLYGMEAEIAALDPEVTPMTTILIRGGTIVDGSGAPGVAGDLLVREGRIAAIGPDLPTESVDRVLDADGCVVAPGFIDIHTHYDAQVFWDPTLTPSSFHGVTTVVAGNCGFSIAPTRPDHRDLIARTLENVEDMDVDALAVGVPWDDFASFPEYLAAVGRLPLGLNFTAYVGHTALRLYVMGDDAYERAATTEEVERMCLELRAALVAGAAGFATSLAPTHRGAEGKPVPSRLAERAELEALFAVVGEHGAGVVEVTPGTDLPPDDVYDLQLATGVPFTMTALLSMPTGSHHRMVELNRAGWARGARVFPQVTPRPLAFAMTLAEPFTLNVNPHFAELMSASVDVRRKAYEDQAWRDEALRWWETATGLIPRWDTYEIAESAAHPEHEGRRLDELAAERGGRPFDAMLDLALDEPDLMLRVRCILANDDPVEVGALLTEANCTLGLSDAGAHVGQLCDAPQATDLLGNWVRERGTMTIEAAVHKLTKVQSDLFGLVDRGELRPGAWADVVVFDPATVAPGPIRRIADFPAGSERLTADAPVGVRHVLVNGVPIRVDEQQVDADGPGRMVAPGRALIDAFPYIVPAPIPRREHVPHRSPRPEAVHVGADELPWADIGGGNKLRLLQLREKEGLWIVENIFQKGFDVQTHRHTGPVWGYTVSGAWKYKEYDYVNRAGSFLYEPAGSVHTLECIEDDTQVWFHMYGVNLNLDAAGNVESVADGAGTYAAYMAMCEAQGLGTPNVVVD